MDTKKAKENANIDIEEESDVSNPKDDLDIGDDYDLGEDMSAGDLYGEDQSTMEKHKELLQSLTNFDPYLREKFFAWSGLYWDEEKKVFERDPFVQPIMNAQGAKWCISYLSTYVRNNNIITSLEKETYNYLLGDVVNTTVRMIADYHQEFGITSSSDQKRILDELENSAQLILCGTAGGKYNELLSKTTLRQEHVTFGQNDQDGKNRPPGFRPRGNFVGRLRNLLGGDKE